MTRPFQLLEINVTSAQDLAAVSKCMRTYALLWIHPERKLSTKVDQHGHTNPHWNEKFVFRVDEGFLNAESSSIMIEIYAAAWLRDVQIGSVRVLVNNLFPSQSNNAKMRYVALQIRRPSGRPQGILNLGVQLLDNTMRSMPLYTELSASMDGAKENADVNKQSVEEKKGTLRRTKSDVTDMASSVAHGGKWRGGGGSMLGSSMVGSLVNSSLAMPNPREQIHKVNNNNDQGNGSMLNGSMVSDPGPSASVVAAAIAQGLIKSPGQAVQQAKFDEGSSLLDEWMESETTEGLKTKLDRWRAELPPIYDDEVPQQPRGASKRRKKHSHRRRKSQPGVFMCFGSVCGCEISITCGGGNNRKRM